MKRRIRDQQGFTLIELLVVIMIIGVLAEIAIPSFLGQTPKADDVVAKSAVQTAQTAIESYRVEHGDYCGADQSVLVAIESSLAGADNLVVNSCPGGNSKAYTMSVTSHSGFATVYTISSADGVMSRTCSTPSQGGCSPAGTW
jgi:type IV pilus assembly protein PilA